MLIAAAALLMIGATACSTSNSNGAGGAGKAPGAKAGVVKYALPPGSPPNWIWPFPDPAHLTPVNLPFQELMFRPLYWFGKDGKTVINPDKSVAELPQYSADRKTVTIKLKPYNWSDGTPLSAQNVIFWINMAKSQKSKLGIYVPGYIPDNIVTAKATDEKTVVLTLDKAYNTDWYTFAQLSQIFPFPEAWNVTGPGQKGTCSTSEDGCPPVYDHLLAQAKDLPSYATNPLWQVVNGPWRLKSFDTTGNATLVPNDKYSGPDKPKIKQFVYVPFTSDSAEYNVLRAGQTLDVGYIPANALPGDKPEGGDPLQPGSNPVKNSYDMVPGFPGYGISFLVLNYNNPTLGPVFKQQYFRQALASTVDQKALLKAIYKGYGVETTGPVPLYPDSKWVPDAQKNYAYPFDIEAAKKYLSDNGWNVVPGGASTCAKPGTGAGECGAGVKQGQKLSFEFLYFAGQVSQDTYAQALKSNAGKAGIDISLHPMPGNVLSGTVVPCSGASCTWAMSAGGWYYVYYPGGEMIFGSGAGANFGSFGDPELDKLIKATHEETGDQAMLDYAAAASKKLPGIWTPFGAGVTAYAKGLKGYLPSNPYSFLSPEDWYFE
ncbi:hypothetical protein Skr01_66920 [Sphaerisporangium krabiense]|uniref:Peptide/nickel transport system substrate-binding protein n=1 Tax=Sphaerisporangium krabiense TaxID=763782 RepID=A0A7W9DQP0_9ACTN|nr:peptide ABC transporter substrate-binding protein [Sphaerisporangium krabiense]MBB5627593.1 peptide/nickel transport system substrate-binding protein [Sphaerisporangium krabiense]GII66607.1 hypothetical protein Skr01_66920 [Sphaerisporangium krabiense]